MVVPWVSSPAKAGDPVFREANGSNQPCGILDAPLSRGMTSAIFRETV
jgi:hypothetical protein